PALRFPDIDRGIQRIEPGSSHSSQLISSSTSSSDATTPNSRPIRGTVASSERNESGKAVELVRVRLSAALTISFGAFHQFTHCSEESVVHKIGAHKAISHTTASSAAAERVN